MKMEALPHELQTMIIEWAGPAANVAARSVHRAWNGYLRGRPRAAYGAACADAADLGNLVLLKWLQNAGCHCSFRSMSAAIKGGHVELIDYLLRDEILSIYKTCRAAARFGSVATLKLVWNYIRDKGYQHLSSNIENQIVKSALCYGHRPVLEWCYANYAGAEPLHYFLALSYGHVELYKWLYSICGSTGYRNTEAKLITPTSTLESVTLLYNIQPYIYNSDLHCAVKIGNQQILEYICSKLLIGSIGTSGHKLCNLAAKYGKLNILKWLQNRGGIVTNKTLRVAVRGGNVELLKHLLAAGLGPINCIHNWAKNAVLGGVPMLEYLSREHGLIISEKIIHSAWKKGKYPELEWLWARRPTELKSLKMASIEISAYRWAEAKGILTEYNRIMIKTPADLWWVLEQEKRFGVRITRSFYYKNMNIAMARHLHVHGEMVHLGGSVDYTSVSGNLPLLKVLVELGMYTKSSLGKHMDTAYQHGNVHILEYLRSEK